MGRKRDVVLLLAVFNLTINKALCLPENIPTRIMLVYDKRENIKEFRTLNSGITEDMDSKIRSWREEKIEVDDIIHGLNSNEIDMEEFPKLISYRV